MSVVINGSAGVTTNSGAVYNGIQAGTAVASTSGTSIDFTSIPSWVKRITVMFNGVSTNGSSNLLIQIGSGSVTTSGYTSNGWTVAANYASSTNGFVLQGVNSAATTFKGINTIALLNSNLYVQSGVLGGEHLDINEGNVWVCFASIEEHSSTPTQGGERIIFSIGGLVEEAEAIAAYERIKKGN